MFAIDPNISFPANTKETPHAWQFQWTPEETYKEPVHLVLRAFNLRVILSANWQRFTCSLPNVDCGWQCPEATTLARVHADNKRKILARFPVAEQIPEGETITFTVEAIPPYIANADLPVLLDVKNEQGEILATEGPASMGTTAGQAVDVRFVCRPAQETDNSLRAIIQPLDTMQYPTAFEAPIDAAIASGKSILWRGTVIGTTVIPLALHHPLPPDQATRLVLQLSSEVTAKHPDFCREQTSDGWISVESNPIFGSRQETPLFAAFGALHWHTRFSGDGMRTLEDGLTVGRDCLNLDFIAPGDHNPANEKWRETVNALEAFYQPDHFATLFGWEKSSNAGHVNFYFTDPNHRMNPDFHAEQTGNNAKPAEYMHLLSGTDFLAIPHHTNAVSWAVRDDGTHYWTQFPWGEPKDEFLRQVEMFQTRGNFEREDPGEGWRTIFRNNGASVQSALAAGHKVGFVGGTDNHLAWPAQNAGPITKRTHEQETQRESPTGFIYTGAWPQKRDREQIFKALYNRHTWACWDTRAVVHLTLGGVLQGDELNLGKDGHVKAQIQLAAEAPLETLELVSNSRVWDVPRAADQRDICTEMSLDLTADDLFVYLRARQEDGALIYASPVFLSQSCA